MLYSAIVTLLWAHFFNNPTKEREARVVLIPPPATFACVLDNTEWIRVSIGDLEALYTPARPEMRDYMQRRFSQ